MKKRLMMALALACSAIMVNGQPDNELLKDFRKLVLFSGSDSTTVYIAPFLGTVEADGEQLYAPWEFQDGFSAIPENEVPEITKRVKMKNYERYKVKDYDGFVLGDKVYHSVNVKTTINIGDDWMFLKLLSSGKINLYAQYKEAGPITSNGEGLTDYYTKLASEYEYVYKKANNPKKTGRLVLELTAKKDFADCPSLYERYKNKEFEPEGGSGKIMGMYSEPVLKKINLRAIEAYNASCD